MRPANTYCCEPVPVIEYPHGAVRARPAGTVRLLWSIGRARPHSLAKACGPADLPVAVTSHQAAIEAFAPSGPSSGSYRHLRLMPRDHPGISHNAGLSSNPTGVIPPER